MEKQNKPLVKGTIHIPDKKNKGSKKKQFTDEQKKEWKQQQRSEVKALVQEISENVKTTFVSGHYQDWLNAMSQFHNYSVNNCFLILRQKPDATRVAGLKTWNKLGRTVKKGEQGIRILAPAIKKVTAKDNIATPTDESSQSGLGSDGTEVITGSSFANETYISHFIARSVFDISQTEGKELPSVCEELKGTVEQREKILKGLQEATQAEITLDEITNGAKGYYLPLDNTIHIKKGMDDLAVVKTGVHEAAHALFDNPNSEFYSEAKKADKEIRAESVAYIVCNRLGLDTSSYSFEYVTAWAKGQEPKVLTEHLQEIEKAVSHLEANINKHINLFETNDSLDVMANQTASKAQSAITEVASQMTDNNIAKAEPPVVSNAMAL